MQRSTALRILIPLAALALILLTFSPILKNDFVNFDDQNEIFQNPDFNPVTFKSLAWNWTHTRLSLYMPVTYIVWGAIAAIAPRDTNHILQPATFHAFSLLLHLICSGLLYLLLRQLFQKPLAAILGTLIFATHPLQAEPVAWASGMYTLLSTALCLAALILHVATADTPRKSSLNPSSVRSSTFEVRRSTFASTTAQPLSPVESWKLNVERWTFALTATALYTLALLTKPAAASLPLIAAAIDFLLLKRPAKKVLKSTALWFLLAIPIILIAKDFQDVSMLPTPPLWQRPLIALDAIGFYLHKMILPLHLSPDYGRNPTWILQHPSAAYLSIAISIIALSIALITRRRFPAAIAGLAIFIAGTAPYLGLTSFDFQYVSTVADRYTYFALIGLALFVAMLVSRFRFTAIPLIVIVLTCALLTHQQVQRWKNSTTLFNYTLWVNPQSLIAHNVFGYMAAQQHHYKDAESHYLAALQIWPQDATIHFDLGNLYLAQRPDLAVEHLQLAVQYQPKMATYRNNLAVAYLHLHQPDQAYTQLTQAIADDPSLIDAHNNLADLYANASFNQKAVDEYQTVLHLDPQNKHAFAALANLKSK